MYDALSVSHFRAFEKLEISPLHRVNLIAGGNNVGKTSVLEAIWFAAQENPFAAHAPALFRRSGLVYESHTQMQPDDTDNFWKWLFFQKDTSLPISINLSSSTTDDCRTLTIRFDGHGLEASDHLSNTYRPGSFTTPAKNSHSPVCTTLATFLPSPVVDAERVNKVSVLNRDDELAEYLREIDTQIKKLKYLKLPGHQHPYVYADVGFGKGKELIPVTQLGQGIARMLGLFSSLMTEKTQILLIDEFENGLQHDALAPIWSALGKFARENDVQVFATTHSYECIAAAHEAFAEHAEDFAVIKLRPGPSNGIAAVVLDHEAIGAALNTELEIR